MLCLYLCVCVCVFVCVCVVCFFVCVCALYRNLLSHILSHAFVRKYGLLRVCLSAVSCLALPLCYVLCFLACCVSILQIMFMSVRVLMWFRFGKRTKWFLHNRR